jgi:DNA-binding response OmpR family regulator
MQFVSESRPVRRGPDQKFSFDRLFYLNYRTVLMRSGSISHFDTQRVLVVEDEAAFAAMLLYNLETYGFLVEHVTNGQEALSRGAKFRPHVVVLDWTLPVMCGIEVCRRLRSLPETKDVGVIMVTARTGDQNAVRGLNAGADDYVVKPFSIIELLARIRALLRRTRAHPERRCLQLREIVMDLTAFRVINGRNVAVHVGGSVLSGPATDLRLMKLAGKHGNSAGVAAIPRQDTSRRLGYAIRSAGSHISRSPRIRAPQVPHRLNDRWLEIGHVLVE